MIKTQKKFTVICYICKVLAFAKLGLAIYFFFIKSMFCPSLIIAASSVYFYVISREILTPSLGLILVLSALFTICCLVVFSFSLPLLIALLLLNATTLISHRFLMLWQPNANEKR